jgi:hypothetical protein
LLPQPRFGDIRLADTAHISHCIIQFHPDYPILVDPKPKKKKIAIFVVALVNAVQAGSSVAVFSVSGTNIPFCLIFGEKND